MASREYGGITPSLYFPVNRPNHQHNPPLHPIFSKYHPIGAYKQIQNVIPDANGDQTQIPIPNF